MGRVRQTGRWIWVLRLAVAGCMFSQSCTAQAPGGTPQRVLDRVIAVVNSQVILASDLELELRIRQLLPLTTQDDQTPKLALQRLTTRALIEQQILQEDPLGMDVSPKELEESLLELQQTLPACKQRDCATAAGWTRYLASIGLEPVPVASYWRRRIAVLRFIEQRFRSGIRIAPEEIEAYYRDTLMPQYAKPSDAPPLKRIAQRIEEILLQQRLNGMMNDWLKSLQAQGEVEILDPALREAGVRAGSTVAAQVGLATGTGEQR